MNARRKKCLIKKNERIEREYFLTWYFMVIITWFAPHSRKLLYEKINCYIVHFNILPEKKIDAIFSRLECGGTLERSPLLWRFIVSQFKRFRDIACNSSHALCFTCCWHFVERQISHRINQRHEHNAISHKENKEVLNQ